KAMGLLLKDRNQAQVSMNLTDFEQTSVQIVFETVRAEAKRHGVTVAGSEIVGLIPQKAIEQVAESYLKVENFRPEMILENRLADVISRGSSHSRMSDDLRPLIDRVAAPEPVPGGGSIAALAGSLGAALGEMAIGITKGKKNYQEYVQRYTKALDELAQYRKILLELVDADSDAYAQVMAAYKLPKDSPDREKRIQDALVGATSVPSRTAQCAVEALRICEDLRPVIHPNVTSDFEVAVHMLRSAIKGGIANIRINLASIKSLQVHTQY